jgi:hypothetical protein
MSSMTFLFSGCITFPRLVLYDLFISFMLFFLVGLCVLFALALALRPTLTPGFGV